MTLIRRMLALSSGVAAGVSTAPYLCVPDRTPVAPRSCLQTCDTRCSASGCHGGSSSGNPAEKNGIDAASGPARVACVTESLLALYGGVCDLLNMATRALVEATANAAATGVHRATSATTAEHTHNSPVCSNDTAAQCADCHLRGATEEERHLVKPATNTEVPSSASTQSNINKRAETFRAAPHKLKDRFLHYAMRDPATGELVLSLEGFVRCMLLLPDDGGADVLWRHAGSGATSKSGAAMQQNPSRAFPGTAGTTVDSLFEKAISSRGQSRRRYSWLLQLPPPVLQRFIQLFHWIDLDGSNLIGYAEFVVLFTFLSTPQQTLERAFRVFDLGDNGRLNEWEFCHLLNTIMVDPAVQVRYAAAVSGAGNIGEDDAAASPSSACTSATPHATTTTTTATTPYSTPRPSFTPEAARLAAVAAVASVASASRPCTAGHTGALRRNAQERHRHKDSLSYELSSELMRPFLFGPLPLHIGAPPGSTHYDRKAALTAGAVTSSTSAVSALPVISDSAWWRQWGQTLHSLLSKVWTPYSSCAPASCGAEYSTLPLASVTASASTAAAAAPSRLSHLQMVAQEDSLLHAVSYSTFLYRVNYLRWELRAIEFSLCDPANTGAISLDDCRRLLCGDGRGAAAKVHPTLRQLQQSGKTAVTWPSYQKILDVVRESDKILVALQLTLDAMPPVPEEMLRGGAIPDEVLGAATQAIPRIVRLSALRQASTAAEEGVAVDAAPLPATAEATTSQNEGSYGADRISFIPADGVATSAGEGKHLGEKHAASCQAQAPLVRPTALTWNQFNRVLVSLSVVAQLSEAERSLFRELLDEDDSDSLSPAEFARVCALKETFFAQQLPRFDEPKRNAVQQFFYCMQQLE
ncbi:hypothetical protein MNV84_03815 [Leishmania braziliensis]|nr:hypothetical protein MNV84_03815 [Leishmania braziliensis]